MPPESWLHGGMLRAEGTDEGVLALMPLATARGPWLSSRKLSVESNGFDFLGQLAMAGYLVFGACWSGLRKSLASSLDQSAKVGYLAFDVSLDRPVKESGCLTWLSPPVATLAIESCFGSHAELVLISATAKRKTQ